VVPCPFDQEGVCRYFEMDKKKRSYAKQHKKKRGKEGERKEIQEEKEE